MGELMTGLYGGNAAAYTVAALAHMLHLYRRDWGITARWMTRSAYLIHSLSVVMLIWQTQRAPVYTVFEAAWATTWLVMLFYILYDLADGNQTAGTILVPLISVMVVVAAALPKPLAEPEALPLPASLQVWHISVILLGCGFFVAAFVAGVMYLMVDGLLRRKAALPVLWRLPSLEALDIWGHRFVGIGFPLLTLGLGVGGAFAEIGSISNWFTDGKVVWSTGTWLIYAGYLLMRRVWGWGGRRAAWLAIVGFMGLVVNYLVINSYLSGFHRFGA